MNPSFIVIHPSESAEYSAEFEFNFQRALLLSLLRDGDLTQEQFDRCIERLSRKNIDRKEGGVYNKKLEVSL